MSEQTGTSSYDSVELRPFKQTHEGVELPWDEQEQRYCGHVPQRFAKKVGITPENTALGFLSLIGITEGLKKGLYRELNTEDMAEFIKASTEISSYKTGADPRFWYELDEETRRVALDKLRQNQNFQEFTIISDAVDILDMPEGVDSSEQL